MSEVNGNTYISNSGTIYDQSGMTQGLQTAAKKPEGLWETFKSWFDNGTHGKTAGGLMGVGGGSFVGAIIGSIVPGVGTVLGAVIGGMIGGSVGANVGGAAGEKNEINAMNAQYQEICNREIAAFYGNSANGQVANEVGVGQAGTRSTDYSGMYNSQTNGAANPYQQYLGAYTAVGMGGAGYDANMYGQLKSIYQSMGMPESVINFYIGSAPSANGYGATSTGALTGGNTGVAAGAATGAYAGASAASAGAASGTGTAAPASGASQAQSILANFDSYGVGTRLNQASGTDFADKQYYDKTDDNKHNISMDGQGGDDDQHVWFGDGNDYALMDGGDGNDRQIAEVGHGDNQVYQRGGSGNDVEKVYAGDGSDYVSQSGGTGKDELYAELGDNSDYVVQDGGDGADELRADGCDGSDSINQYGGKGNDDMEAHADGGMDDHGNNSVYQDGGEGDDNMRAYVMGYGSQTMKQVGGEGNDKMSIEFNRSAFFHRDETGDEMNNIQLGGSGNDEMNIDVSRSWFQTSNKQYAESGDNKMHIEGGRGEDVNVQIADGDGDNEMVNYGNAGNDTLKNFGGSGNDKIVQNGGADDDNLTADGGAGDDEIKMIGGDGNDMFTYNVSAGNDKVLISGYGEEKSWFNPGQFQTDNAVINFKNGDNFTIKDADGKVLYQQGKGGSVITVQDIDNLQLVNSETQEKVTLLENGENSYYNSYSDYLNKTGGGFGTFGVGNYHSGSSVFNFAASLNNNQNDYVGNGETDPLAFLNMNRRI